MDPSFRSLARAHEDGGESHAVFLVAAVVVSIALHTLFGWATRGARLTFLGDLSLDPAAAQERNRPWADTVLLADGPDDAPERLSTASTRTADPGRETVSELMESVPTESPATMFDPPAVRRDEDPAQAGVAPPVETIETEPVAPWQPRERILEIASKFANDDLAARPRTELIPDIERQVRAEDVVAPFVATKPVETALDAEAAASAWVPPAPPPRGAAGGASDELLAPPVAAMPAQIEAGPAASGETAASFVVEAPEEVRPAVPLDDVLAPRLSVYRPRRDDGFVYFEIDVARKGEDVLPPIPRDVLLVQDASGSLGPQRLAPCRKALKDALAALRPGDRFNVLVFNTDNTFFRPGGWADATPENLAAAGGFLDAMVSEGRTDIFNAMRGALSLPRDPGRTAVALLLSDGASNAGDFRRDSQIIGEFSKLNDGSLSVFDVGVSRGSDEYLLSMLSLCNRGAPAAIPHDRFEIPSAFGGVFGTLGSPVLADVRFLFDSASGAVVAPERTENLYLDRPLRLYGRAPAGTKTVSFQARGVNAGKGYDMVYEMPLGDPEPGSGDSGLAQTWARARIYDLVAAYVRSPDPALLSEMAAVGRAHDVKIPFDGRFLRQ